MWLCLTELDGDTVPCTVTRHFVTLSANASHIAISEPLTAVASKVTIIWHMASCNFVHIYRQSGEAHCCLLKGTLMKGNMVECE
jgi:hypothetical protein